MELLVSLASVAALRLRNLELHEEAIWREQLQKELDLARQIQVALFPNTLPRVPGYELYASNRPSQTVSGDLYRIEARDFPPSATRPLFSRCSIRKPGIVRYANAGHNPALVLREQGGVEELHSTGIPLGIIADAECTTEEVTLEPGDTIVIYTDGVTEARNHQDEEYAPRHLP